jgi:branched-subunit amino acid transport protein
MTGIIAIVAAMTAVTYLPRLLPFILLDRVKLPPFALKILDQIPYAALGVLLVPGVFDSFRDRPLAAAVGMGVALLVAWLKGGLVLPILGAVAAAFILR